MNTLKIDRQFVQDIDSDSENRAITLAICAMARTLELMTVAEGVETTAERQVLLEAGVDVLQGWWYARAMPRDECEQWIRDRLRDAAVIVSVPGDPAPLRAPYHPTPRSHRPRIRPERESLVAGCCSRRSR